jgi:Na+/melibiose symporter-like transporter
VLEIAGFDAAGENDAEALLTLSLLYGAAPVVLKLAAIAIMRGFPVTAEKQAELRRKIDLKSEETSPGS